MKISKLNIAFALHLIFFGLVVSDVLPRSLVLYETIALALYLIIAPLEDGLIFFVRCIPLFIAIPLTATFDNFNQWRIFSGILFLKFLIFNFKFLNDLKAQISKYKVNLYGKVSVPFIILLALACLSVFAADDKIIAIKRIIYFLNASLTGVVIWYLSKTKEFSERLIKNIAIPTLIVALVGVVQVISTYLMDIYQFMRVWGEGIQLRQFGEQWSYIATHVGNTWFAYYGDQLSLRVFSLFPDSHSFPIFLLLGLPAVFAIFRSVRAKALSVGLLFLMVILSGTRGMWLAGAGAILWSLLILLFLKYKKTPQDRKRVFSGIAAYLGLFILLFGVAYPIAASPQFLLSKPDALLLQRRLRSVLDLGETSNAARIAIWKASWESIRQKPLLGVGIGNFPVVLGQDIKLARAGSSAHNLYVQIAAETGMFAFLALLYLIWLIIRKLYHNFIETKGTIKEVYAGALLITIPWVLAYLMTDVAIFDERALLLFTVTFGLLFSNSHELEKRRDEGNR
ncbi:MAG: hypothetical protein A2941_01190 [Candidatus Yanofskybacteria bacterium RIFCSPLOWO2_01_FULL_49_17]|uniref:O-antigen ligase-related domain-containing protein n=1 Tax=Candidatus Yanofskybacteria bacterium RIFCSPLOWO2_01_FULL_49_17 TaxID=1802700 RepID=A0A1F8GQA4_9BACT|nr:MAG: hypothetical protein A2941_01190 [Candidatus Yanofskybacteria bacterium RIFCSPLOWO2_01_FULL_49_17]